MTLRAFLVRSTLGLCALSVAPVVAAAQSVETTAPAQAIVVHPSALPAAARPVPADSPAGPRLTSTVAGVRLQVTDAPALPAPVAGPRAGRGQALTIVGGAAFLGGLIIGGDAGTVIAVGGLGVGIYGLWLWLGGR